MTTPSVIYLALDNDNNVLPDVFPDRFAVTVDTTAATAASASASDKKEEVPIPNIMAATEKSGIATATGQVQQPNLECKEDADEVIAEATATTASKKRSILDEEEDESNKKMRTSDRVLIEGIQVSMTVEEISNLYCNLVPEVAIFTILREPAKVWHHEEIMVLFTDIETRLDGSDKLLAQIYLPHAEREAGYIDKVIACAVAYTRFTGDPLRPEYVKACELEQVNVASSHCIYCY